MRIARAMTVAGIVVAAVSAIVTVVFVAQPWWSCSYEDTAFGCAMLPLDAAIMVVAAAMVFVGIVVAAVGAARWHRGSKMEA